MAIECLVITFILGAIVFSFARADRIRWVIATVPLGILPLANCVSCFVCTAFLGCELPKNIAAVILLLAVMASCVWIGIASGFLLQTVCGYLILARASASMWFLGLFY